MPFPTSPKLPVTDCAARVTIGWWNTGLAPPVANASAAKPNQSMDNAATILNQLFAHSNPALILLGEITTHLISKLCNAAEALRHLQPLSADDRNIAVLYDSQAVTVTDIEHIRTTSVGRRITVGRRLSVQISRAETPLDVVVVHWPSRLTRDIAAARTDCGRAVHSLYASAPDSPFVCIGDFNDEPFDSSLVEGLRSSRDKSCVVESRRLLLYNPFWRHLGHNNLRTHTYAGTHYYKTPQNSWHTFDQAVVGHSLVAEPLTSHQWRLIEEETGVFSSPDAVSILRSRSNRTDHLPIYVTFQHGET
jgi:hypothetical protein